MMRALVRFSPEKLLSTPTFEEVYRQIKTNLSFIGIYPTSRLFVKYYFLIIVITLMVVEELSFFVQKMSPENLLELTALAPCLCVGVLSICKVIPVALHKEKVFKLAKKLNDLSTEILSDRKKENLIRKNVEQLKNLNKYYFVLNAILISVYNFATPVYILYHYVMTKEEIFPLPFDVIVPFSTERWSTWTIVYLHSITCGFICVLYFTTVDCLYFLLTSYVCSIFTVLSNEIRELVKTDENKLKEMVKKHQQVIELADDLEVIFTMPNFFNVFVGSLEICALGFNLMIGDWSGVPGCVLFILSVLLQIFMISVFGERLMRESANVGEAAFHCEWYIMSQKSRKIILLLMLRSHKAQRLTANKFSVICYDGFTKIISTSWSYFTILRTIYAR